MLPKEIRNRKKKSKSEGSFNLRPRRNSDRLQRGPGQLRQRHARLEASRPLASGCGRVLHRQRRSDAGEARAAWTQRR